MNTKLVSYFLIFIMVASGIVFIGASSNNENDNNGVTAPQQQHETEGFFNINGKVIYKPFDDITDAMNLTPAGVAAVRFVSEDKAAGTLLESIVAVNLTSPFDTYYPGLTVKRVYSATYPTGEVLLMHYLRPKGVTISWTDEHIYDGYMVLNRTAPAGYTVMGDPTLFSNSYPTILGTLDVIENGGLTASEQYAMILELRNELVEHTSTSSITMILTHPNATLSVDYWANQTVTEREAIYLNPSDELSDTLHRYGDAAIEDDNFTTYLVTDVETEFGKVIKVTIAGPDPNKIVNEPLI
ncbi:MAG: hypothetical protein ACXQS2_05450 [Methermicoccaceae archaeon]